MLLKSLNAYLLEFLIVFNVLWLTYIFLVFECVLECPELFIYVLWAKLFPVHFEYTDLGFIYFFKLYLFVKKI